MLSLSSLVATEFYKQQTKYQLPSFCKRQCCTNWSILIYVWQLHKRPLTVVIHSKKAFSKTAFQLIIPLSQPLKITRLN